jgi:hypothetical protein
MKSITIVLLILLLGSCRNKPKQEVIVVFNDYSKALSIADQQDKNILVLFFKWGYSTLEIPQMVDEYVKKGDLNGFVYLTLMTDDKEIYVGDSITIGDKNLHIQKEVFGTEESPVFYIINSKGKIIKGPLSYCTKEEFKKFISAAVQPTMENQPKLCM